MENAARTERDKLIVRVLADCGIRLQELLAIQPEDVREARKGEYGILVHGKGGKDRIAPLQPVLYRRLRQFISGGGLDTGERIFLSIRRDALGRFTPLTDTGVEQVVKLLARAAGITKRVYPHLIRHSYATNFLRKGGKVIALQRILGHANLDQIQATYVHLDTSDDWQANMAVLAKD
jgi:site-specific recombinase XerD